MKTAIPLRFISFCSPKTGLRFVVVALLLVIFRMASGQPPLPGNSSPGDSLRNEGNLRDAIQKYHQTYLERPNDLHNLYNYACALSLFGQADSSFRYLEKYIVLDTAGSILTDPDFINLRNDYRWEAFEEKLVGLLAQKFKTTLKDPEYAKALWKLGALDQAYFIEVGIAGRKVGMNSSVQRAIWDLKARINKENLQVLEALIRSKGWPKISKVGSQAAEAAFLVVQHSNPDAQKKYLPLLQERCIQHEADWSHYALLFDRIQTSENKPQRYGTQSRYDEIKNTIELYPLEDPEKVNFWRKEAGLEPLPGYKAD